MMSAKSSDSEGKGWTVVNKEGEVDAAESSDDASSHSSLEFVQLDEGAARFHLRTRTTSMDSEPKNNPDHVTEALTQDNEERSGSSSPEPVSPSYNEIGDEVSVTEDAAVPEDSAGTDSDGSSMELIGAESLKESYPEQMEEIENESGTSETATDAPDSHQTVLPEERMEGHKVTTEPSSDLEDSGRKDEELDLRADEEREGDLEQDEKEEDQVAESGKKQTRRMLEEPLVRPGCSRDVPTIDLNSSSDDPPVIAKMKAYLKQFSDSDSDSDFVRLDGSMMEEGEQGAVGGVAAVAMPPSMASSSSSMATSTSSVSSNFRFIHPFALPAPHHLFQIQPHQDPDNEDDNDPVPGDVDDRCESDISGVAGDTSDLSSVLYQMGDAPLTADDVPRSYCHQPNERLDAVLTTIALLALFLAVGIGIGHFIGTTREFSLRKQYINRMKELQDDYLMCLRDQSILQNNIKRQPPMEEKFGFLMAAWQEKYQELLVEKASLEAKVADLERHLVDNEGRQNDVHSTDQISTLLGLDNLGKQKIPSTEAPGTIAIDNSDGVDIMELEGHIAAVETLEQELKQRLADSEQRLQEYVKLQAQATETIHALQTRLYQVDGEKHDLTQDVGELQAQHTQLQIHNNQMENEKKQLVMQNSNLRDVTYQLDKDKADLQMKNSQLENQNVALVSQLKEEQNQKEELKSHLHKIEEERKERTQQNDVQSDVEGEQELYAAIQTLKDELNQVEQEKSELLTNMVKLRYKQHPGNSDTKPGVTLVEQKHIKNQMNQLIAENDDLKTTVGKMRYSPLHPVDDGINDLHYEQEALEKLTQRLIKIQRQLAKEMDVSHLWQTLYVAEKVANEKRETGATSSFMTCLSLLLPQVTPGKMGDWLQNNASQFLQLQWHFLQNVTRDTDFMKNLQDRWVDLQRYVGKASDELKYMPDEALAVYSVLQRALSARWESFIETNFTMPWLRDVFLNATQSEPFQQSVEKSRHTVRQLKDTVHHTWEKVRDMSSAFLKQHEATFDNVKGKVKEKISNIGLKVQNKMEEVQKTLKKTGFFGKAEKEKSRKKRETGDQAGPRKEKESDRLHYEKTKDGKTSGHFADKPSHKQTQSDTEAYKQYQEYWRHTGFEPDDILEEGFFQGNNREWRKHQKTLRKLHGRIHGLNEDVITSMDDDEIEDIYDDLEDLQEDLDDAEQPEKLKTWLTCQIRWWKSRFQRKKRDEDLIRGCGKQMMHWQLRVICKEVCGKALAKGKGKSCKTCSAILSPHPQGFHNTPPKTVAKSQPSLHSHDDHENAFTRKTGKRMDKFSSGSRKRQETWMDYVEPQVEGLETNASSGLDEDWYLKRMLARDDNKGSSQWYMSRMENREDRRHDSLWYVRGIDEHSQEKSFGFHGDFTHKDQKHKRHGYKKDHARGRRYFSGFDWEQHISEEGDPTGQRTVHHRYRYSRRHPRHGRHHRNFS